jgi:hypothetical protein
VVTVVSGVDLIDFFEIEDGLKVAIRLIEFSLPINNRHWNSHMLRMRCL